MTGLAAFLVGLPQRGLIAAVRAYRLLLSPWLGSGCRFEPTCSAYALQALDQYGAAAGSYLTLRRLGRCHPLCAGGHDPLPATRPRLFRTFDAEARSTARGAPTASNPEPNP